MLYRIPQLIEHVSGIMTLEEGDVILTGSSSLSLRENQTSRLSDSQLSQQVHRKEWDQSRLMIRLPRVLRRNLAKH